MHPEYPGIAEYYPKRMGEVFPSNDVQTPPQKCEWMRQLPCVSKVLALLCLVELLVVVGTATACLVYYKNASEQEELIFVSVMSILSTLVYVFFVIDSIRFENKFQFACAVVIHTIMLLYSIWFVIAPSLGDFFTLVSYIVLGTTIFFQAIIMVLGCVVADRFGFLIYHRVGTKIPLQSMYQTASVFFSLLKLDLATGLLLLVLAGFYLFEDTSELVLNISMLLVTLCWMALAVSSVYNESYKAMWLVLCFSVIEPAYIGYKLYQLDANPKDYPQVSYNQFATTGGAAILIRFMLIVSAWKTKHNFGRGLLEIWKTPLYPAGTGDGLYPSAAAPITTTTLTSLSEDA
eukprot:g81237.t1